MNGQDRFPGPGRDPGTSGDSARRHRERQARALRFREARRTVRESSAQAGLSLNEPVPAAGQKADSLPPAGAADHNPRNNPDGKSGNRGPAS